MLKMILADDEPVITKGIKKLVDWDKFGIQITGVFPDGQSTMEEILKNEPDLALLDINMPGMNGIEILKNITVMGKKTKVIFISGFQDFEYAKNAISYGAVDYLLKPVIREELLRAVQKAIPAAVNEEAFSNAAELLRTGEENMNAGDFAAEKPFRDVSYVPVLTDVLFTGTESEQEKKLIRFSLYGYLEEKLSENRSGIIFSKNSHIIFILKNMDVPEAGEIIRIMSDEAVEATGKKCAFIVGNQVASMSGIPDECRELIGMEKYLFFSDQIGTPVLIRGEKIFRQTVGKNEMEEAENALFETIISQNREKFERAYQWITRVVCILVDGRREDACYYFCNIIERTGKKIRSLSLSGEETDIKKLLEMGRSCATYADMAEKYGQYLENDFSLVGESVLKNEKKEITEAKEYIESHYRDNITLETMAGIVHMNPYYFSNYFKKNTGENFKDYLNRVRMQHAISLLLSSDMKTYEISDAVGFSDVRAFTDVFQKLYHETPFSYKKRIAEIRKKEKEDSE